MMTPDAREGFLTYSSRATKHKAKVAAVRIVRNLLS
jgi:hypothetical protein